MYTDWVALKTNTHGPKVEHQFIDLKLWHVPPRSPDLNPVEKFWAWLRRELRKRDLRDLQAGRQPLGRIAYSKRVGAICKSPKSQQVGANILRSFKKDCVKIVKRGGAYCR